MTTSIDPKDLSLRIYPDPILKTESTPFELPLPDNIEDIAERMLEIMYDHDGIGLAANQAGFTKRMIVYDLGGEEEDPHALINPVIIKEDKKKVCGEEGCLSFPEIRAEVMRADSITIEGYDIRGEKVSFECNELLAVMFQHEIDHLNGINFVDRLQPTELMQVKHMLKELESY